MSLLIKGMEMPDINDYNGISCCLYKTLGGELRLRNNETGQFFDVVPLKPHGRLIDANALFEKVYKAWGIEYDASECNSLMGFINKAPTIIPAEVGETDGN